jgi:hypothetical protein
MKIDASEVRALGATLKTSSVRVGAKVGNVVRESTLAIERGAKATVLGRSYEFGDLYDSISSAFSGDGRFASMSGEVVADSDHAVFVENGTSVMAAEPFLGPAFDAEVPNFERRIAAAGGNIL